MGNDSGFGRRNSSGRQPVSQAQARQRGAASSGQGEDVGSEIPTETETSQRQIFLYVAAGVVLLLGTVTIALVGLPMLSDLIARYSVTQTSISNAGPPPEPARTATASEETLEVDDRTVQPAAEPKAGAAAGNSRQHAAAMKFFGFYHLNTRARGSYCGNLGVDMTAFNAKFRQTQTANYQRASTIIAKAGLTEDQVYEQSRSELETAIRSEQEQIAQKMGMPPAMGCMVMAKQADKVIPSIDFAKIMPEEHKALAGS